MPTYQYTAKNLNGTTVRGSFEAESKDEVLAYIREKEYIPLQIHEIKNTWNTDINTSIYQRVKPKDLAIFCRQFATTLHSGITVADSLNILRKQTTNKRLAQVLDGLYEDILKGNSLSASMALESKVFPFLLVSMVETGEVSGNLDNIMESMADHFEKEYKLNQKVRSALTYPIVVSVISVLVVIILLTFVMPTFVGMFDSFGAQLPLPTRILMGFSDSIRDFWYLYGICILGMIYGFRMVVTTEKGRYRYHRFKLKMWLFGSLNTKIIMARFASTLSVLLNSGIDILQGMEIVQKVVNNAYIRASLDQVKDDVRKGYGLGQTMENTGKFPPMVYQMVQVGENSGTLDYVLEKVADFYDAEVETAVSQLTTLIEPLIIVVLGCIVGFIVVSMIMPIFDLYNIIGI
ncbi:MAG: type II secretion system F family protein [Eubacteriales bacterium]